MDAKNERVFGKLDTWFIDKYLKHDGETLDEAKIRIAAAEKQKREQNLQKNSSEVET